MGKCYRATAIHKHVTIIRSEIRESWRRMIRSSRCYCDDTKRHLNRWSDSTTIFVPETDARLTFLNRFIRLDLSATRPYDLGAIVDQIQYCEWHKISMTVSTELIGEQRYQKIRIRFSIFFFWSGECHRWKACMISGMVQMIPKNPNPSKIRKLQRVVVVVDQ